MSGGMMYSKGDIVVINFPFSAFLIRSTNSYMGGENDSSFVAHSDEIV